MGKSYLISKEREGERDVIVLRVCVGALIAFTAGTGDFLGEGKKKRK